MKAKSTVLGVAVFFSAGALAWTLAASQRETAPREARAAELASAFDQFRPQLEGVAPNDAAPAEETLPASDVIDEALEELPPVSGPRLSVSLPGGGRRVDLGSVRYLREVETEINVTNTGSRPLTITGAHSSCACLAVVDEDVKDPIKPGEHRAVRVHYRATSQMAGRHRKVLALLSDDPERPRYRIPFSAEIVLPLTANSTNVELAYDAARDVYATEVSLSGIPGDDTNWSVQRVRTTSYDGSIRVLEIPFRVVEDRVQGGVRRVRLAIEYRGPERPGKYVQPLMIDVDHPDLPQVLVTSVLDSTRH